jgi:hypothetical protein
VIHEPQEEPSMTLRPFGNVVPIQIDVLALAGYRANYRPRDRSITLGADDDARKRNMRRGRRALRRATGQDFGYDLAAWHNYLAAHPAHGYTHAYAYAGVARAVRSAIASPVRRRLAEELAAEEAEW